MHQIHSRKVGFVSRRIEWLLKVRIENLSVLKDVILKVALHIVIVIYYAQDKCNKLKILIMTKITIEKPDSKLECYANQGFSNLPECITHFTKEIILITDSKRKYEKSSCGIYTSTLPPEIKTLPGIAQKVTIAHTCSSAICHNFIEWLTEPLTSNINKTEFIGSYFNPIYFLTKTECIKSLAPALYGLCIFRAFKCRSRINKNTRTWLSNIGTDKNDDFNLAKQKSQSVLYVHNCIGRNFHLFSDEYYHSAMEKVQEQMNDILK